MFVLVRQIGYFTNRCLSVEIFPSHFVVPTYKRRYHGCVSRNRESHWFVQFCNIGVQTSQEESERYNKSYISQSTALDDGVLNINTDLPIALRKNSELL